MKGARWFRHDDNAAHDRKMLRLSAKWGVTGYGAFWRVIEYMHANCAGALPESDIEVLAVEFRWPELPAMMRDCCDWVLFESKDGVLRSGRLDEELAALAGRKHAGEIGAQSRWNGSRIATASRPHAVSNADKTRQDKTEDSVSSETHCIDETSEPPIPYEDIIGALNEETGHSYEWQGARGEKNRALIRNLVKRGFKPRDFLRVIESKCAEWGHPPKHGQLDMRKFLRPATLFQASKFEGYLNSGDT